MAAQMIAFWADERLGFFFSSWSSGTFRCTSISSRLQALARLELGATSTVCRVLPRGSMMLRSFRTIRKVYGGNLLRVMRQWKQNQNACVGPAPSRSRPRLLALETDIHQSHDFYRLPIQQSRLVHPLDHGDSSSFYEQR